VRFGGAGAPPPEGSLVGVGGEVRDGASAGSAAGETPALPGNAGLLAGAGLGGCEVGAWRTRSVFGGAGAPPPEGSQVGIGGKVRVSAWPGSAAGETPALPGNAGLLAGAGLSGCEVGARRTRSVFGGAGAPPPEGSLVGVGGEVRDGASVGSAAGETPALPGNADLLAGAGLGACEVGARRTRSVFGGAGALRRGRCGPTRQGPAGQRTTDGSMGPASTGGGRAGDG
jgi:hypothetical protein